MFRVLIICLLSLLTACAQRELLESSENEQTDDLTTQDANTLDLREANVLDISYDEETDRFGVTLQHDDDNEEGYADWWQLETLDGELLGRRVLTHRHDNNPFTRYETIEGLEDIVYVVARGHDQDHGYGGQVLIMNLETGETETVEQGSEKQDFTQYLPKI